MSGGQGRSTRPKMSGMARTQLLADSFFSDKNTIQLVTGEEQKLSVNLNRNLLLFHSPLLRSIFSNSEASSSSIILVPHASTHSLVDLEVLLKEGEVKIHPATKVEDMKHLASSLGINLKKLSKQNFNIQTDSKVTVNKQLFKLPTVSKSISTVEKADNALVEQRAGVDLACVKTESLTEINDDFQKSLDQILGEESEQNEPIGSKWESGRNGPTSDRNELLSGQDDPTIGRSKPTSLAPRGSGKEDGPEFTCQIPGQKCTGKSFDRLHSLRVHYSQHFRSRLKSLFAAKMVGDECYQCKKKFDNKDKLACHIGAEHQQVDKILREEKGIILEKDFMTENSLPPKQKKKASSVLCNYDTQCEVCGKEVGLSSYLPVHVSNHFHEQLKERFHSLATNLKCRLCGLEESSSRALYRHLGVQHLKVNEILLEKGFRILPSSLTKKQEEKQEHLMQIKKEMNENPDQSSSLNIDQSTAGGSQGGQEELGLSANPAPVKKYEFTDISQLYPSITMKS